MSEAGTDTAAPAATAAAPAPADRLAVQRFDGVSARPQPAELSIDGDALCVTEPDGTTTRTPLRTVQWPERQRHGARVIHLPDGAALHCAEAGTYDAWAKRQGLHESWVVKAQQSWRSTFVGTIVLIALCGALYVWGLPLGARALLAFVPPTVDRQLGDMAMQSIRDEGWVKPSELPAEQQQRLRAAWSKAEAQGRLQGPPIDLYFHKSRLGPNAFALPGGHVVLTDEMVALVGGREDILIGVLAHEAGHVHRRHGMRMLAQTTLLGSITSVAFGDFSGLLATAPAVLGHLGYSRDFEREADDEAIALLTATGISPAVMAEMFERLAEHQENEGMPQLPIALGSHPPGAERIARFRETAGAR